MGCKDFPNLPIRGYLCGVENNDFPDGVTADAVRELRMSMGLTQTQFGKLLGVVKRTVSNWERGQPIPALSEHRIVELAATRRLHADVEGEASSEERIADLERRVDYLEQIVMRQRVDELAMRRGERGLSEGAPSLGAVADSNTQADAEVEGRQGEP